MMTMKTQELSLPDALSREIERCQELLIEYEGIPTGAFGASTTRCEIEIARGATEAQDAVAMVRAFAGLRECR